jgi:hypothetical protein
MSSAKSCLDDISHSKQKLHHHVWWLWLYHIKSISNHILRVCLSEPMKSPKITLNPIKSFKTGILVLEFYPFDIAKPIVKKPIVPPFARSVGRCWSQAPWIRVHRGEVERQKPERSAGWCPQDS